MISLQFLKSGESLESRDLVNQVVLEVEDGEMRTALQGGDASDLVIVEIEDLELGALMKVIHARELLIVHGEVSDFSEVGCFFLISSALGDEGLAHSDSS